MKQAIRLITDGACLGNPGSGGWAALILRPEEIEEIGGYEAETTNNRMELRAAIEGLRHVGKDMPVLVFSDSTYLLNGITKWLAGWKKRSWTTKTDTTVLNRDLWEELDALNGKHVQWEWTRGHAGNPENERADFLAQSFARGLKPHLTHKTIPQSQDLPVPKSARTKKSFRLAPGFSAQRPNQTTYLSLIDGELERYLSWEACKKKVSGVINAKFKKCASIEEEISQIEKWGLDSEILSHPLTGSR